MARSRFRALADPGRRGTAPCPRNAADRAGPGATRGGARRPPARVLRRPRALSVPGARPGR